MKIKKRCIYSGFREGKECLKFLIAHLALKTRCFNIFLAGIIRTQRLISVLTKVCQIKIISLANDNKIRKHGSYNDVLKDAHF